MSSLTDDLQSQLTVLAKSLHALIVARQAALASGQDTAAQQLAVQIQQTAQLYNGLVVRLRELEGPGTTLAMLDQVGDVIIKGAKTGATVVLTAAGDVVEGAGKLASGIGVLAGLMPWLILAAVAIIGYGVYTGAIKVKV